VDRRDVYLSSVQMKREMFALHFYSPAECSSPVAAGDGQGTGLGTKIRL
jgi:hypothetical protein